MNNTLFPKRTHCRYSNIITPWIAKADAKSETEINRFPQTSVSFHMTPMI